MGEFKTIKGSNFFHLYQILFVYLQFCYFIVEFINNYFWLNSEKFFSGKKELVEFIMYYKFFLFSLFLNKKNKFFKVLFKFSFHLYFNYLVFSIFYFLRLYVLNTNSRESENNNNNLEAYSFSSNLNGKSSYLFYSHRVYSIKLNKKKILYTSIEEVPLSLFCSNRINFKSLNDIQFSKLLNHIRYIYRYMNKKENSLGLKFILTENKKNKGSFVYSYENRLFLNLLNILFSNIKEDFIYQSDKNSDVRKEAYSRGYYLKTLK